MRNPRAHGPGGTIASLAIVPVTFARRAVVNLARPFCQSPSRITTEREVDAPAGDSAAGDNPAEPSPLDDLPQWVPADVVGLQYHLMPPIRRR